MDTTQKRMNFNWFHFVAEEAADFGLLRKKQPRHIHTVALSNFNCFMAVNGFCLHDKYRCGQFYFLLEQRKSALLNVIWFLRRSTVLHNEVGANSYFIPFWSSSLTKWKILWHKVCHENNYALTCFQFCDKSDKRTVRSQRKRQEMFGERRERRNTGFWSFSSRFVSIRFNCFFSAVDNLAIVPPNLSYSLLTRIKRKYSMKNDEFDEHRTMCAKRKLNGTKREIERRMNRFEN